MTNIQITDEFKQILDACEKSKDPIFITGCAGTGKSTLIREIKKRIDGNSVIVAPTGVAAINIKGQTIHSFFKIAPRFLAPDQFRPKGNKVFEAIDTLIIDEISMVRADLFDAINLTLQKYGPEPDTIFGGVRLIMVGDMEQLPPIISREEEDVFYNYYKSADFRHSYIAKSLNPQKFTLTKPFRQQDEDFIKILENVRNARNADQNEIIRSFEPCVSRFSPYDQGVITLATTNALADSINQTQLGKLPEQPVQYEATIKGSFKEASRLPSPENLVLKKGAQVMFTRNDASRRWQNGTIGVVAHLDKDVIQVMVQRPRGLKTYDIERATWQKLSYQLNNSTGKITEKEVGSFTQFPLQLAWAVTIHKSQGQTLDKVHIDLGNGAFAKGQLYVALSRARSLESISLARPISNRDMLV